MIVSSEELMRTYLNNLTNDTIYEWIDQYVALDAVDEGNYYFSGIPGRDGFKQHVQLFRKSIDELTVEVDDVVGAESRVSSWWRFEGVINGRWLWLNLKREAIVGVVFSTFDVSEGQVHRYRVRVFCNLFDKEFFDSRLGRVRWHVNYPGI